jgi:hypothetical protein
LVTKEYYIYIYFLKAEAVEEGPALDFNSPNHFQEVANVEGDALIICGPLSHLIFKLGLADSRRC